MKFVDMLSAAMAAGELPGTEGLVGKDEGLVGPDGRSLGVVSSSDNTADAAAEPSNEQAAVEVLSEWAVPVVRIERLVPVEDSHSLSVALFTASEDGFVADYPVVVRTDSYSVGDCAVYVPVDSVIPDSPEFAFLGSDRRRLRAKKLRGVYSEGLLVPWIDFAAVVCRTVPQELLEGEDPLERIKETAAAMTDVFPLGTNVAEPLGIRRWEPITRGYLSGPRSPGPERLPDESWCPVYSVSNAKKGQGLQYLSGDTRVIVTEKLHGANIRFAVNDDNEMYLGSHRQRRDAGEFVTASVVPGQDWFQRCAANNAVFYRLVKNQVRNIALYGEVLGVQDIAYGSTPQEPGLRIFDAYAIAAGKWLDWPDVVELCRAAGFDHAPVLYDGPLDECPYKELAEGQTTVDGANHVREGVVIRTYKGGGPNRRWKYVGQGYRLRRGNQTDATGEQ